MTRSGDHIPPNGKGACILPFAPASRRFSPTPSRRPAGLVATLSIDATEVARLVARDLADEWVKGLIADHQRRSGPPSSSGLSRAAHRAGIRPTRRVGAPGCSPTAGVGGIKDHSDPDLGLFDSDGLIRTAKKIPEASSRH